MGLQPKATAAAFGRSRDRPERSQHPRCVFQIAETSFRALHARDGPAWVADAHPKNLLRVAELLSRNSGRERTGAIVYALGWTQHSTGVQMIRAAGIIQLLLGNMGRPGGGIMAMRGHCSIQGSTDIPTLYDLAARLYPATARRPGPRQLDRLSRTGTRTITLRITARPPPASGRQAATAGLLGEPAEVHDQPAQGLVRRRRDRRQ